MNERLGPLTGDVDAVTKELEAAGAVPRIWSGDHTLWRDDPTEITDRLGWLESPGEMSAVTGELDDFVREVKEAGYTTAVVAGMGGSSLFALVMAEIFEDSERGVDLHVLDSTDPAAIRRAAHAAPLDQMLVVVASKSGTTIETRSHLAYLWERIHGDAAGQRETGDQFVAITDPGSPLADLGAERGFRRVFENRPDIGGRFSALSYFGLVPAALAGADLDGLLGRAAGMANASSPDAPAPSNPAARLGATLGAAARDGRDKLTLLIPDSIGAFGAWVEQLIAESTGKQGTGVLPVVGEPVPDDLSVYGNDRLFVSLGHTPGLDRLVDAGHPVVELDVADAVDLGAEVFRWEFATAVAGAVLEVNPFDQPDVAAAKQATADVLANGLPDTSDGEIEPLLDRVGRGDYVAILAYVDPDAPIVTALERSRRAIRDRLGVATTLGLGPRYLHSTGQLHKGGPNSGVFLQVVSEDVDDVPIPGEPHGFSVLKRAQAAGDLVALRTRGRRAERVGLEDLLSLGNGSSA